MTLRNTFLSVLFFSALMLSACATRPAPDSGYLMNSEILISDQSEYPFHRVWVDENFAMKPDAYSSLYIAPVNTDYVKTMAWYEQLTDEAKVNIQTATDNLATYMHARFEEEFIAAQLPKLNMLTNENNIDSETLVLELAIVELRPTPAQVNRLTSLGGFFVPFLGVAKGLVIQEGSIAIEGRFSAGASNKELMLFADREEDNSAILVDASDFTYFRHARKNIDTWAQQVVSVALAKTESPVQDSKIKLKPW